MQGFRVNRESLVVSFNAIERGYFVKGMGFDFFATLVTVNGDTSYLECRDVHRFEDLAQLHLIIPMQAKHFSCDLLETLIIAKLSEYWNLNSSD